MASLGAAPVEFSTGYVRPLKIITFAGHTGQRRVRLYFEDPRQLVEQGFYLSNEVELSVEVFGRAVLLGDMGDGTYSTQFVTVTSESQTIELRAADVWPEALANPTTIVPDEVAPKYNPYEKATRILRVKVNGAAPEYWHYTPLTIDTLWKLKRYEFRGLVVERNESRLLGFPPDYNWALVTALKDGMWFPMLVKIEHDLSEVIEVDVGTRVVSRETFVPNKLPILGQDFKARTLASTAPQLQVYTLEMQVTREGEVPDSDSYARLYFDENTLAPSANYPLNAGVEGYKQYFSQAILGDWYVTVMNFGEPRMGSLRWPTLAKQNNTLRFDLSEGEGGTTGGDKGFVKVQTFVEGVAASRDVVVVEHLNDGTWRMVGFGKTDELGEASVEVKVLPDTKIFSLVPDDYGSQFVPNQGILEGERVRPSTYRGWVYEATKSGTLPELEPVWWPAIGDNVPRDIGTARLKAVRYFQPLAHGPVPAELEKPKP